MDARERFLRVAHREPVDRVPLFEEVVREEVLERWYGEGLSRSVTEDNYRQSFGIDRSHYIYLGLEPRGGSLRSKRDFRKLEAGYRSRPQDFQHPRFWHEKAKEFKERNFPLGIMGWRGFMLPLFSQEQEWDSLQDVLLALYDFPALMKSALDLVTDCYIDILRLAMRYLDFDFGVVSEPIASSSGPVISPETFREFVLPCHRRIVDFFHDSGMNTVVLRSISNIGPVLPAALESGADGLWVNQVGSAIDYLAVRQAYPDLLLIGGLDSRVLAEDEASIQAEITRKVPPLLARGRYLPGLDDNPRENVPYRNYRFYRDVLRQHTSG